MNFYPSFLVAFLVVLLSVYNSAAAYSSSPSDKVQLHMFIMSKCPDVASYYARVMNPLMHSLGDIIDLRVDYIANEDQSKPLGFASMHGETEVQADLMELCLQSSFSHNQTTWWNIFSCGTTRQYRSLPGYLETCLHTYAPGMSYQELKNCAYGIKGKQLMLDSIDRTHQLGVRNSPTLYIEDDMVCEWHGSECKYQTLDQYMKDICSRKQGEKPVACHRFE